MTGVKTTVPSIASTVSTKVFLTKASKCWIRANSYHKKTFKGTVIPLSLSYLGPESFLTISLTSSIL
jgi:hypothetical protein